MLSSKKTVQIALIPILSSVLILGPAQAATPVNGSSCSKLGSTKISSSTKFKCIKYGKKLIWRKESSSTVVPSLPNNSDKVSLQSVVASAAISNSTPVLDASASVGISENSNNIFSVFINGSSAENFLYLGPKPLTESSSARKGAISLITDDRRMVYQSQSSLSPWGLGFSLKTSDQNGRFVVATSAVGISNAVGASNQPYAWRLAFKKTGEPWKYQSIEGTKHASDNTKRFDVVSLGAPGTYLIRLEFTWNTTFYGLGVSNNQELVTPLPNSNTLRVVILGDSWVYPIITEKGQFHDWDAFPGVMSWLSGWNVISAGVPGQGYLRSSAGETYRDRIVRDIVPQHPDVVIFTGSPNDRCLGCTYSDQQIAAEMRSDIQLLQQSDKRILIIACSPFISGQPLSTAMRTAAESLGVPFVDFSNPPLFTQDNNFSSQIANGHPTRLGGAYIATQLLKSIALLK